MRNFASITSVYKRINSFDCLKDLSEIGKITVSRLSVNGELVGVRLSNLFRCNAKLDMYSTTFNDLLNQYGKGIFQPTKNIVEMSLVGDEFISKDEEDAVFIDDWYLAVWFISKLYLYKEQGLRVGSECDKEMTDSYELAISRVKDAIHAPELNNLSIQGISVDFNWCKVRVGTKFTGFKEKKALEAQVSCKSIVVAATVVENYMEKYLGQYVHVGELDSYMAKYRAYPIAQAIVDACNSNEKSIEVASEYDMRIYIKLREGTEVVIKIINF